VDAHQTLIANPGHLATKVRFVTLYHLVIESTLGLTSFKFVTDYLNEMGLLPGFVKGYSSIHRDETRHIAYGIWFLRESVRERPDEFALDGLARRLELIGVPLETVFRQLITPRLGAPGTDHG
jgi:ribonucleoside-diphosphate reductase beta chain